jgi:quinol monooxygenase YgiN
MIMMNIVAKVGTQKREEFMQTVHALNCARKKQAGLRELTSYQEIDDPAGFNLIYEWETQEDLERYLAEEDFRVFLGALKVLGEKSVIKFRHFTETLPDMACSL